MENKFQIGDMVFQVMEEIKDSRIKSAATVMSSAKSTSDSLVFALLGNKNFKYYGIIKTADKRYLYIKTDYIGYIQKKLTPNEYIKAVDLERLTNLLVPEEAYMVKFELRKEPEEAYTIYKTEYEKAYGSDRLVSISEGMLITDKEKLTAEILNDFKPVSAGTIEETWVSAKQLFGKDVYPPITINDDL